ncbi:MAG: zinc-binding dehydrogenase [Acidobacteriota bacterium]|nr:zinc-binding dehydrogenase [Acidobacteriota bacterium]
MNPIPATSRQLRSTVDDGGTLTLSLVEVPIGELGDDEVLLKVEAAPINPSDLGLLLAGADVASAKLVAANGAPEVVMTIEPGILRALGGRLNASMPVGNEGAGTVVATGSSAHARALLGRTVSVAGGAMYAEYRVVDASQCLVLPEGTPARLGASSFVNPLTALGMVATMRREGHTALVHTAAASNLGQMLVRLCASEGVPLVNVVRRPEQAALLRGLGAQYVCDSSSVNFMSELIDAVKATSATLAFDATGGGNLASQILTAMEVAASASAASYSRYGSTTHKQVYIYGGLDRSPTTLTRSFGFAWGVGGWLLTPFLQQIGPEGFAALRQRVAEELTTTFASSYSREISLEQALDPEVIASYARQATGEKYLVAPHASSLP